VANKSKRRKATKSSRNKGAKLFGAIPTIVDALPQTIAECVELGMSLEHKREFWRANRAFAHAVKLAPNDAMVNAHYAYTSGRVLDALGAAKLHAHAMTLAPTNANVMARHGQMFMDNNKHEEAAEVLTRALALEPNCAEAHKNLCWSLRRLGKLDEAIEHGEAACRLSDDPDATFYLTFACLSANRNQKALELCERTLAMDPRNIPIMSLMVTALERCGRREDGRRLADFDSLIFCAQLNTPAEYPSLDAFNAELARIIMAAPSRPLDATQTLDIFEQPQGPIYTLWRIFNQVAQRYLASLPANASHPFLSARPERWVLDAWGNRLRGNPEQEHHFHHHGWLSGVYYVDIPPFVNATETEETSVDGCIEFSRFNAFTDEPTETEFMVVRPQAGTIVLFPSFVNHRVLAYQSTDRRISIAFNLTPTAWQ
jgi:tetratricopeptide (TPR) repeat protein